MLDQTVARTGEISELDLEDQFDDLFECIEDIVEDSPEDVPELLTLILALPPFREILNRQELLTKAVVEAKKLVSAAEAGMTTAQAADAALSGQRPVNVQQLRPTGPMRG